MCVKNMEKSSQKFLFSTKELSYKVKKCIAKKHGDGADKKGYKFIADLGEKNVAKFSKKRNGKNGDKGWNNNLNAYLSASFFKYRTFFP